MSRFKRKFLVLALIVLSVSAIIGSAQAQSTKLQSHEIGRLWDTRFATGTIPNYAPISDQLTYPGGDYFFQTFKNMRYRGHWIGVKDWTDKYNKSHTFYVSEGGPLNYEAPDFTFPIYNRKYVRARLPNVMVNGQLETRLLDSRRGSAFKPTLKADEEIITKWATDVGITVTRKSYAFANPKYDSFIIMDYEFKNTGNADQNYRTIELPNQDLHGVYFGFLYEFIPSGDVGHEKNGGEHDDWVHYYGAMPGDTLRGLWYCYDGDSHRNDGDDIGDPSDVTGEFLSPQYVGFGVLHADASVDDPSDDPNQPATIDWLPHGQWLSKKAKGSTDQQMYLFLSSGKKNRGSDILSDVENPWDPRVQDPMISLSFGPYDIPFGKSIHIVVYNAVGMISRLKAIDFGKKWKNGELSWNGLTGDQAKDAIIATGKDSLFMFASEAQHTWEKGLASVPDGPEAPNLTIDSGPGKNTLTWYYGNTPADSALPAPDPDTGEMDLAGFRVFRTEGQYTNVYSKIWECGEGTGIPLKWNYVDRNVERGRNYYYYVVAFDHDGNESSHFYNRNYQYAGVPSLAARSDMDSIYVVPNPYHVQGLAFGGTLVEDYREIPRKEDQISFVGLPAKAIIRVFTVKGDLVATIHHPNPDDPRSIPESADEAWFQISDSWQTIKSGVYFYQVEGWNLEGKYLGTATGKFVIIR